MPVFDLDAWSGLPALRTSKILTLEGLGSVRVSGILTVPKEALKNGRQLRSHEPR